MSNFITSYVRNESGAAAAEYALILALITVAIVLAVTGLGGAISTAITTATADI